MYMWDHDPGRWSFLLFVAAVLGLIMLLLLLSPEVEGQEVVIVEPPERMPSKVIFAVDVSGSIDDFELSQQLQYVRRIVGQLPSDGAKYTAVAFASNAMWMGEWVDHPSHRGERQLQEWVKASPLNDTSTSYESALMAIRPLLGEEYIGIVWLTDGMPTDYVEPADLKRLMQQYDPSMTMESMDPGGGEDRTVMATQWTFIGFGTDSRANDIMKAMAEATGGGFIRVPDIRVPEKSKKHHRPPPRIRVPGW